MSVDECAPDLSLIWHKLALSRLSKEYELILHEMRSKSRSGRA